MNVSFWEPKCIIINDLFGGQTMVFFPLSLSTAHTVSLPSPWKHRFFTAYVDSHEFRQKEQKNDEEYIYRRFGHVLSTH